MPICSDCVLLTKFKYYLGGFLLIYKRRARQLKANSVHCRICKVLYDWLPGTDEDDERTHRLMHLLPFYRSDPSKDLIIYGCRLTEVGNHPGHYRLELVYYDATERPISPEVYGARRSFILSPLEATSPYRGTNEVLPYTGDPHSLDQSKVWLQNCVTNHKLCRAYSSKVKDNSTSHRFRPKRLIEILPSRARLHDTRQGAYHYIALSHRWPEDAEALLRLTTDNIEELRRCLPIHSGSGFSKVFSDALDVCRHLGVFYIWIDSLCIIQHGDAGLDWAQESVRMSDIYQNAVCTISADSIEDGLMSLREGMFRERDTDMIQPIICTTKFNVKTGYDAGPATYRLTAMGLKRPEPGTYVFMPEDDWSSSVASSPLFKRGWIMQERLLSQRILHFAKDQLHFTCCEMQASETWPEGHPIFQISKPFRTSQMVQDITLYKSGDLRAEDLAEAYKLILNHPFGVWYWIAHTYTATDLTRATDKLVAISGVAKAIQPYVSEAPEEYCAGIWRRSLPHALLWRAGLQGRSDLKLIRQQDNHPVGSAQWRAAYQAPSWSWASVNWHVRVAGLLHDQKHDVLVTIVDIDVRPYSDRFGQVEAGSSITLRGSTYGVNIVWKRGFSNVKPAPKFLPEVRVGNGLFARSWGEAVFPDERYIEAFTKDVDNLRALPVLSSSAENPNKWQEMLLLRALEDGAFTRFGYMRLVGSNGRDWIETMKRSTFGGSKSGQPEEIIKIL